MAWQPRTCRKHSPSLRCHSKSLSTSCMHEKCSVPGRADMQHVKREWIFCMIHDAQKMINDVFCPKHLQSDMKLRQEDYPDAYRKLFAFHNVQFWAQQHKYIHLSAMCSIDMRWRYLLCAVNFAHHLVGNFGCQNQTLLR